MSSSTERRIKTRFLILSDTHGATLDHDTSPASTDLEADLTKEAHTQVHPRLRTAFQPPLPAADVAIHCGDLTVHSTAEEYARTFSMIRALDAPLKLVIAGNHDGALDESFWGHVLGGNPEVPAQVKSIIRDASQDGVHYLTEGTHHFTLRSGALLKVYASQYTPEFGMWGFQYPKGQHDFDIPDDVHLVVTHGPPKGALDLASGFGPPTSEGCPRLMAAVARSRPQIHCFGHIHESWGAHLARWKDDSARIDPDTLARGGSLERFADASRSKDVLLLEQVSPSKQWDHPSDFESTLRKRIAVAKDRAAKVNLTDGDFRLEKGRETLFVNAAIMSVRYAPTQAPWLIDVDLPENESG